MIRRLIESPFLYLLIFLYYAIGLTGFSVPLTGDQKVYLSIALEMREKGEWLIPQLFHEANFLKPPFQYWATLMGWKIFGLSLFGALLPSVIAMMGAIYFINHISWQISRQISKNGSKIPGLVFAATIGTMTYATTAQMEIWIVFFYVAAWSQFLKKEYFSALFLVGMMAWVKGPLYPVLWVMSVALWYFLEKDFKSFFKSKFLMSLGLGVVVGLAWYAAAAQTHLQEMLNVFLLRENVGKMQTGQGSPIGLWSEFLYSIFPVVFLFAAELTSSETRSKIWTNRNFYISYAAIPALFFTFFPYRVNTYLYLLMPAVALMMGESEEEIKNPIARGISSVVVFLSVALSFLLYRLMMGHWIGPELAVPMMILFLVWGFFSTTWNKSSVAMLSLILVSLIRVAAVQIGEKDVYGLRSFHEAHPQTPLAYWIEGKDIWHEFGLMSAAMGQPIGWFDQKADLESFLKQGGAVIYQDEMVPTVSDLKCEDWWRLKRRTKFPLQKLLTEGVEFGDPSLMRKYVICTATK